MPSIKQDFDSVFSIENLTNIFQEDVSKANSSGTDGIDAFTFSQNLNSNIAIIHEKVYNKSYRFTRYKQKLISKGPESFPREVCIPTIRDRITLKALNQFLQLRLKEKVKQPLPQRVTKEIKRNMREGNYNWVIKLDIKNFYPCIRHKELIKRIKRFIKDETALTLIEKSINQSTKKGMLNEIGIPQGLPISNILSALYLINLDKMIHSIDNVFYSRYVDDILILCEKNESDHLTKKISSYCKRVGLTLHTPDKDTKTISCSIKKEFSFLGYLYNYSSGRRPACLTTTKQSSITKLTNSLTAMFVSYSRSHRKSQALLEWKLNLRITGCISDQSCKGWVFFFSEIEDKSLLYGLDNLVTKLCNRFSTPIITKSFVRTWHEINSNRKQSSYIPNFSTYNIEDMVKIIECYHHKKVERLADDEATIKKEFWKIIKREERDLEADIQGIS